MPITQQNKDDIKEQVEYLCEEVKKLSGRDFLSYNINNINKVFQRYENIRDSLKPVMRYDVYDMVKVDRHKVSSLMLISLMKEEFISIKPQYKTQKLNPVEKHANIYLGYFLGKAIIRDFYNADTGGKIAGVDTLNVVEPAGYAKHFRKLIYNNENIILSIAKCVKSEDMNILFFISHLFYFIEQYSIQVNLLNPK